MVNPWDSLGMVVEAPQVVEIGTYGQWALEVLTYQQVRCTERDPRHHCKTMRESLHILVSTPPKLLNNICLTCGKGNYCTRGDYCSIKMYI